MSKKLQPKKNFIFNSVFFPLEKKRLLKGNAEVLTSSEILRTMMMMPRMMKKSLKNMASNLCNAALEAPKNVLI